MEMEFRDEGRRRKILIGAGIVLAVVAGAGAFLAINRAQSGAAPQVATRTVLVAARDIPARTVLQTSDLTQRAIPDDPALASAITDPQQVVGRLSGVAILLQQPITPNLLASTSAGAGFSILGPNEAVTPESPAWRAVSIMVPDDRAVAGQIQVGQRVDIFVTAQVNVMVPEGEGAAARRAAQALGAYYTDKSTKVTYQNVEVLAKTAQMYILKVDEKTAEEINHLQASGNASFGLTLRPDADARQLDTTDYGQTTNRIIERYGLPIPEVYPRAGAPPER